MCKNSLLRFIYNKKMKRCGRENPSYEVVIIIIIIIIIFSI